MHQLFVLTRLPCAIFISGQTLVVLCMVTDKVPETAKLSSDGRGGSDSAEVSNPRAWSGVMPALKYCATSSVSYQCNSTKRAAPWARGSRRKGQPREHSFIRLPFAHGVARFVELHWLHRWLDLENEVWFIKIDIYSCHGFWLCPALSGVHRLHHLRVPWHMRTRKPRAHDDSTCCVRCGTAASWKPQACGDRTWTKLACEGNIHVGREVQMKKELGVHGKEVKYWMYSK